MRATRRYWQANMILLLSTLGNKQREV